MYIKNLIPKGATIKPPMPQYGLYNNVLLTDKRRGLFHAAIAPIGVLNLTSNDEKFILAEAISPCVFIPSEGIHGSGEFDPWADANRVLDVLERWFGIMVHEQTELQRNATLPDHALDTEQAIHVAYDDNFTYGHIFLPDLAFFLNEIQLQITLMRPIQSPIPAVIGMSAVVNWPLYDPDSKTINNTPYRILRPKATIKFRDNWMTLAVPKSDLPFRLMREGAKWYYLVAAAAKRMDELINRNPTGIVLTDSDFLAWAGYTIGAWQGFNTNIDDEIRYTAQEDLMQGVLPWLGLPDSDLFPYLGMDASVLRTAVGQHMYLRRFLLNILLYMAGRRFGARVIPVQYLWRRGNVHIIKNIVPYYLRTPLDLGGSNALWLHPARNTSLSNGIFIPGIVEDGTQEFEINTETPAEQFIDLIADRGEAELPELETMNSNLRIITSRDARVRIVKEPLTQREFVQIIHHISGSHGCAGLEYLMSYDADQTFRQKKAVWVTPSFLRAQYAYTLSPGVILDTELGKRVPVPGQPAGIDGAPVDPKSLKTAKDIEDTEHVPPPPGGPTRSETTPPPPPPAAPPAAQPIKP
jgi:hypothetical protein